MMVCTSMYWFILAQTSTCCYILTGECVYLYIPVYTVTYKYIPVHTSTYQYIPACTRTYWSILVHTGTYQYIPEQFWNHCKIGFRGSHRDEAMLPGPSVRYIPVVESALDEDLDPHPCKENEKFFKNAHVDASLHGSRPHRSRGSLVLVQCSTY